MAVTLTATPLPDDGAVRVRLDAVYDTPAPLAAEDYRGMTSAAVSPYAALWTPSNADGTVATTNGAVRLTGSATAGGTTFTRTLTGLTVGSRYVVLVWQGPSTWVQATLAGQTLRLYTATGSTPGNLTYLRFEFVATATSHALTLTPYVAGQTVYLYGLSVQEYATERTTYRTDIAVSDVANWSQGGPAVTGGYRPAPYASWYAYAPSGWTHYLPVNAAYYSSAAGTTADYPAGSQSLRRTITGLVVGHRYTLTVRGEAFLFTAGQPFGASARWQPGIVGISWADPAAGVASASYTFVATATSHVLDVRLVDAFTASGGYAAGTPQTYVQVGINYVLVEDTTPNPVTYSLASLVRGDASGTRAVRMYDGQEISDGVLVTTDPEVALTGFVSYTAVVHPTTGDDVRVQASVDMTGLVSRSRIAPASVPSLGAWFDLAPTLTIGRVSTTTVAQVINRPDPLVTLGSQTLRSGTLSIWCESYEAGTALEAVFNTGEVALVRQPDYQGLDMYVVGTRTSLDVQPERVLLPGGGTTRRWVLSVDYTEVTAPTTDLRGSIGWTVADSLARNATLDASRAEFPTVLDLLIGPES